LIFKEQKMNRHVSANDGASIRISSQPRARAQSLGLSRSTLNGITIVRVSGAVDSHASGQLFDSLVQCVVEGRTGLIVDVSQVNLVTRAGLRALLVAAKMMKSGSGEMRICCARGSVLDFLRNCGFDHLIKVDCTAEASMAVLSAGEAPTMTTPIVETRNPVAVATGSNR
jgi:anti-anti-sigma factor